MKQSKSPECLSCLAPLDHQIHFALQCSSLSEIRTQYMDKFIKACPNIKQFVSCPKTLLLALLDPFSPLLPNELKEGWRNSEEAYQLSRNYFYDLHKKREKLNETASNKQAQPEDDDITELIINVYQNI